MSELELELLKRIDDVISWIPWFFFAYLFKDFSPSIKNVIKTEDKN